MTSVAERVSKLLQCLKEPGPTSQDHARRLRLVCGSRTKAMSAFASSLSSSDSQGADGDFTRDFPRSGQEKAAAALEELALGTVGMACTMIENDYDTHYKDIPFKDKVFDTAHASLLELIPHLFEYNIDQRLAKSGSPPLRDLCADHELVEELRKEIANNSTNVTYLTQEILGNSEAYRANLIYVYEYFRAKSVPSMITELPKPGNNSFFDILKNWLDHSISSSEGQSFSHVIAAVSAAGGNTSLLKDAKKFAEDLLGLVLSVHAVFAPRACLDDPVTVTLQAVITSAYPQFSEFPVTTLGSFEHNVTAFAHNLWLDWDQQARTWRDDIAAVLSKPDIFDGTLHKQYTYAKDLKAVLWYAQRPDLWDVGKLNNWQFKDKPTIFNCFKPGTLVWTNFGQKPIEYLEENDAVLTRLGPMQYGVRSSEIVATPMQDGHALLYGINGEEAFFTPGHVFHTTTGLRAVDPEAARHENPWLSVGALKVGHVLLHTEDGKQYSRVPIKQLASQLVDCSHVYGVHLREGLRSYHANGYLVHLNYPEITVKSIADALRAFPREKQVELLRNMKELQPVFEKFGAGTVAELLARELADELRLTNMRPKVGHEQPPLPLQYQSRSFELLEMGKYVAEDSEKAALQLPTVDALDGVLYVDGQYCEQAQFTERGLTWVRPITDSLWEYGMFTFGHDYQMLSGTGIVWYAHDAASARQPSNMRRVEIASIALRSLGAAGPGAASAAPEGFAAAMEEKFDDPEARMMPFISFQMAENFQMSEAKTRTFQMHAATTQPPKADFEVSKDSETPPEGDRVRQEKPMISQIPQAREDTNVVARFQRVYAASYDASPYNEKIETMMDPSPLFDLTYHSIGGLNQVKTISFNVPILDKLAELRRNKMAEKFEKDIKLFSYYSTETFLNDKNNLIVKISIQDPKLLSKASDQYDYQSDKELPYQNLTFKKAGSDLELPFVFSQGYFLMDATEKRATGVLREYSPTNKGCSGTRYRVAMEAYGADLPEDVREAVAMGVPGYLKPGEPHAEPPPGPFSSQQPSELSPDELLKMPMDSEVIKKDAQNMIHNAMLYHMDDQDREDFLGIDKNHKPIVGDDPNSPSKLPTAMAEALDTSVKKWLKDTYMPAYIAVNLARQSEANQKSFKINYPASDLKKLEYFWGGKGPRSMSQQDEYNELNRISARLALMRRVPRLQDYLDDLSVMDSDHPALKAHPDWAAFKGGQKWAHILFYELTRRDVVNATASAMTVSQYSGKNALEHHSTILHTLFPQPKIDVNKELSLDARLSAIVEGKLTADAVSSAQYIGDSETIRSAVTDNLRTIIEMVLKGQDEFDDKLRAQIVEDLKDIAMYDHGVAAPQLANAELLASYITQKVSGAIAESAKSLTSEVSMKSLRWAFGPDADPTRVAKWASSLCVVMTVASTVAYAVQAWMSWKQNPDWMDITKLVFNGLQAASGLIYGIMRARFVWQDGKLASEIRRAGVAELEMELFHGARPRANANVNAGAVEQLVHQNRQSAIAAELFADVPASRSGSLSGELGDLSASSISSGGRRSSSSTSSIQEILVDLGPERSITQPPAPPPSEASFLSDGESARERLGRNFNVHERWIRGFAAVCAAVLLVMACLTLAHNWKMLDFWDRAFNVALLVHQFASLILDVVLIFASVLTWITVVLAVVGLILLVAYALYEHYKEKPKGPIENWYNKTGRKFVDDLPTRPQTHFDWTISPESAKCGSNCTITVTGTAKGPIKDGLDHLSGIAVTFTAAKGNEGVLFNTTSYFAEKDPKSSTLETNQVSVKYPSDLDGKVNGGLVLPTANGMTTSWRCIVNGNKPRTNSDGTKTSQQLIALPKGSQIVIQIRGQIAVRGAKEGDDRCRIDISETYLDDKMDFLEMIEPDPEVFFKKIA